MVVLVELYFWCAQIVRVMKSLIYDYIYRQNSIKRFMSS